MDVLVLVFPLAQKECRFYKETVFTNIFTIYLCISNTRSLKILYFHKFYLEGQEFLNLSENLVETICASNFMKKSNLNRHFQNVHKKSKYQCSKCTMVFTDESNKNRHSKKCRKTFPCLKCRFIYITQDDLLYHCYLNHDGPKYSKTFLTRL